MTMRAFLFLTVLAAHAAAAPCDPKCDPKCGHKAKANARATVVAADPEVRIHPTIASPSGTSEASTSCAAKGGLVAVGRGTSPITSSCDATKSRASTTASSAGAGLSYVSSTTNGAEPVVIRIDPGMQSLSGLAQSIRSARADAQGEEVLDEETRESVRAALEEAREAAREAIEEARESTRAALEDARVAQREAQEEARAAHRRAAEEVGAAMREAEEVQAEAGRKVAAELYAAERENPRAFEALGVNAAEVQALTQEAWKTARKSLAEVWTSSDLPESYLVYTDSYAPDREDGEDSADLEDRVRALEEMARGKGHSPVDGSLEERVKALERALGGAQSRSSRPTKARAPRAFTYPTPDGQGLRELKVQAQPQPIRVPSGTYRVSPMAPIAPIPPTAGVPPVPPVAPVAPTPPFPRTPTQTRAWSSRGADAPPASSEVSEDRRAIEDAMRSLRDEAESLRGELMRMREQMESLPRKSDR